MSHFATASIGEVVAASRKALGALPDVRETVEWQGFLAKATPLLVEMRSIAMTPVPASPMK
jgi:hypothetical protein